MSVAALVDRVDALDIAELEHGGVTLALSNVARVRAWCDARDVALARRLDALSPVAERTINEVTRGGRRHAADAVQRARTVDALPLIGEALLAGAVSSGHVDVLGRALNRLPETQRTVLAEDAESLLRSAATSTPEQFERILKARVDQLDDGIDPLNRQRRATNLRTWSDASGMVRLTGAFDPERGALLAGRLHNVVEAMFHDRVPPECPTGDGKNDYLRALALLSLVEGGLAQDSMSRSGDRVDLMLVADIDTIVNGLHERSLLDAGRDIDLPVETYRRLACSANLIPVIFNGDSVPIEVGRTKRLATRPQRRALRTIYDTCAIDSCNAAFAHCEPHHLDPWVPVGATDMVNLLPLCSTHHHAAHEGGWQLSLHADRSLTVTYPDGSSTRSPGPGRGRQRGPGP